MRTRISVQSLHSEFVERVQAISQQSLLLCNQCGKCSAGCPVAFSMDLLPNQVIRLAQLGIEDVLDSQTIWTCAACLTCVSRCPKGIDLPRVMEAMRLLQMERQGSQLDSGQINPELAATLPQLAIIGSFRKYSI